MTALSLYLQEVRSRSFLTQEEETALAQRYAESKDAAAAGRIIEAHLSLVVKIAKQHAGDNDLADLVQEGNIALLRALERFDPRRGVRFGSYAEWHVRGAILKHISDRTSELLGATQGAAEMVEADVAKPTLCDRQIGAKLRGWANSFAETLTTLERDIFWARWLTEHPSSVRELGQRHGLHYWNIHRIEKRLLDRFRGFVQNQTGDTLLAA